jgi:hypothetical protein
MLQDFALDGAELVGVATGSVAIVSRPSKEGTVKMAGAVPDSHTFLGSGGAFRKLISALGLTLGGHSGRKIASPNERFRFIVRWDSDFDDSVQKSRERH